MDEEKHCISAKAFAEKYRKGQLEDVVLLDVREEEEWRVYRLNEAVLIPLQTIPYRLDRLERDKKTYVLCAHGVRSAHAVHFLYRLGFTQVVNVDGGLAEVSLYLDEQDVRPK
ncbi:rhodanese-like domain-containing protein [Salinithrix halophila]|uniref:Rhodanese-like domain-containing protein n=1 Tax=Salinithrix halophila TaxID=1485204 RepID=A0ABV8JHW7_9BACL